MVPPALRRAGTAIARPAIPSAAPSSGHPMRKARELRTRNCRPCDRGPRTPERRRHHRAGERGRSPRLARARLDPLARPRHRTRGRGGEPLKKPGPWVATKRTPDGAVRAKAAPASSLSAEYDNSQPSPLQKPEQSLFSRAQCVSMCPPPTMLLTRRSALLSRLEKPPDQRCWKKRSWTIRLRKNTSKPGQ